MTSLDGKVAVITGGARGQGRSHALTLAAAGAKIVVCDVAAPIKEVQYALATSEDLEETIQLVKEAGGEIAGIQADVRSSAEMKSVADLAVSQFGRIDILLANAGIHDHCESTLEIEDDAWQTMLDVNLTGAWKACKAVVPVMIDGGRGGSIVITSSVDGLRAAPSRMIVEPYRLYDCSRENDGAVALILVSADRAEALGPNPAYVLAGSQGAVGGYAVDTENDLDYTSAGFGGAAGVAETLWADAGLGPDQVDVVQVYENFSGSGVAALIDHSLCPPGADAGKVMTVENLTAPHGLLPVNTSGGNLADSFVNGMGLAVEAVRQVRGTSTNQVPDATVSLFIGGPMAAVSSSVLLCTRDVL